MLKKLSCGFVIICTVSFFYADFVYGEVVLQLPENMEISLSNRELLVTSGKFKILVEDISLNKILQFIQNKSGVLFEVTPKLKEERITATITAYNWTTAVRKLLKDYNRIEFLNPDGTLQKVRIVDRIDEPMPLPPIPVPEEEKADTEFDSLTELPHLSPPPPPPLPLDAPSF